MSIIEITHLATEISKYILMMLFYRNLFVYSRVFFAFEGKLPSPPYPVNLIQSLSFKSTRPRELLATWPRVQIQIVSRGSDME